MEAPRVTKEIDFLIEQDMTLYPMEVKKTAMPADDDIKNFEELDRLGKYSKYKLPAPCQSFCRILDNPALLLHY